MPTAYVAFIVAVIVGTSVGLLVQRVLSRRPVEVEAPEWATSAAQEWTEADELAYRADCKRRREGSA